jgi:uncharacterized protein YukE
MHGASSRDTKQTRNRCAKTVDQDIRGLGNSWYGTARNAYDVVIDAWLADYQRMVNAPLTELLNWFDRAIEGLGTVEEENTQN